MCPEKGIETIFINDFFKNIFIARNIFQGLIPSPDGDWCHRHRFNWARMKVRLSSQKDDFWKSFFLAIFQPHL